MDIRYCPFCGKKLEKNEAFCNNCRADLRPFILMPSPQEIERELRKVMEQFSSNQTFGFNPPPARGFYISVTMSGDKKPVIKTGKIEDLSKVLKDLPIPDFVKKSLNLEITPEESANLEFVEAVVETQKYGSKEIITVLMPGVESMENVEIARRGESLEITGKSSSRIYFAEVDISGKAVVESSLKGGELRITLEKF